MANHENVINIEPMANTTPSPLLPSSQTHERGTAKPSWMLLFEAIEENDRNTVKEILDRDPEVIHIPFPGTNMTPLISAVKEGADIRIIENIINLTTPPEKLVHYEVETGLPGTGESETVTMPAIHWAVEKGNYSAAKLLIRKYPLMLSVDYNDFTPIGQAIAYDKWEMAYHMLKLGFAHAQDLHEFELSLTKDLEFALRWCQLEYAYTLIQQCPNLVLQSSSRWKICIEECADFPCQKQLNIFQKIVYPWIHIDEEAILKSLTWRWEKANSSFMSVTYPEIQSPVSEESEKSAIELVWDILKLVTALFGEAFRRVWTLIVWPIEKVRRLKQGHHQLLRIMRRLCEEIKKSSVPEHRNIVQHLFCSAVQNGVSDIVEIILEVFPNAIVNKVEDEYNALQFAALHRDGKTFLLIHEKLRLDTGRLMTSAVDNNQNNILHLVAQRARRRNNGSRDVLQLQREFQWYKGMEKILPFVLAFKKNSHKQIPYEVFNEEHRDMLKSEGEWITSMANSCMVAGTLIAAVVFAAAITLPGGNKDNGYPNFSNNGALKVFAVSDAFSLIFSLIAVVTFLSIFTTRYSAESFQYDLPNRLIFGLISLFLSVTFMMVAFSTTIYLLFAEDYHWIIYPTAIVSFLPVFFFGFLQLPSLLNIIKSTYFHNIFKDDNVIVTRKK